MRVLSKSTDGVRSAPVTGAFLAAVVGSRVFGAPLERAVYDEMVRLYRPQPWQPQSALLVVDEASLDAIPGGISGVRGPLAQGLRLVAAAHPKAVAWT